MVPVEAAMAAAAAVMAAAAVLVPAMAVVVTAAAVVVAVMAVAVMLGLSGAPEPAAGKIAATAAETASTPVVPVVAVAAAVLEIIRAPKAEPGGLDPPGFQLLGSRDQHFGSGVPSAGLLGDGVAPVACATHPLHEVHQVAGHGP